MTAGSVDIGTDTRSTLAACATLGTGALHRRIMFFRPRARFQFGTAHRAPGQPSCMVTAV